MNGKNIKQISSQIDLKLEHARVRMMYEQLGDGLIPYYAWLLILLTLLVISHANITGVVAWTMLIIVIESAEAYVRRKYFTLEEVANPLIWEQYMVGFVFSSGLTISAGMALMLDHSERVLMYAGFTTIVITALASGALLVSSIRAQYAWVLALLLPLVIKSWISDDISYWIFGSAILFGGLPTAIIIGKKLHKDFVETLRLRFENTELLARAEKASTDKSRFLAATSHDLRQPLHALDLFLGGLKNRLHVKENVDLLLQAQASSSALRELLNALLDVSRFDAGEVEVQKEVVPLMTILRECYAEFLPEAQEKGLQLRLHRCPDYYVETDPVLLLRVLRNYISNAIHYTDSGTILLGARKCAGNIKIGVWDTGKGIAKKQQEHIFDEYYQIDNPERDREKGLGLGLAIVSRVSQLLNYPVGLQSTLGKGSYFHITVPIYEGEVVDVAATDEAISEDMLTGLFVLVVDDHQPILNGMRTLLRDWDCEVLLGKSGDEILQELRAFDYPTPDVMVIDYRLRKEETGVEVIHAIRAFFDADVPAILMTGEATNNIEDIALEHNALFMRKPISAEHLKRLLSQYMLSKQPR
jgi:signal transduction histidine kinase/CheY-like chemotaxis protein